MRCDCCNKALNDYESTLKSRRTGEYLNTCVKCLDGLNIDVIGRSDLSKFEETDEDNFYEEFEGEYDE